MFASHHWPMWGTERIAEFLTRQRDTYAYMHDQTLRRMNQGLIGSEIAEQFELPPALEEAWSTRGYYGSFSHNVKAIYQRYLGWYDGNPAHLWQHPPEAEATRYVEFMGGADAVLAKARATFEAGDLRWTATVVSHVVFADPDNTEARELLAQTLHQLGYGAENGLWRNIYLRGRRGAARAASPTRRPTSPSPSVLGALTIEQLFDSIAIRVDGLRAAEATVCDRLGVHRPRPHLPHRALQRRLHPRGCRVRRRRPHPHRHADQEPDARHPRRARAGAGRE